MGLELYVWDPVTNEPLPGSYTEAVSTFNRLLEAQADVNPRFLRFAMRLLALIQSLPDSNDELLSFYKYFVEETQQVKRAVYIVGLPPHQFMEAIRLIVQSASEIGLVVFYGPPHTVFLPNGQTLPPEQAALWYAAWQHMDEEEVDDFPTTLKDFKAMMESLIAEQAIKHGFEKGKYPIKVEFKSLANAHGYIKKAPIGYQFFYCMYEGGRYGYRVAIFVNIVNAVYEDVVSRFDFKFSHDSFAAAIVAINGIKGFSASGSGVLIESMDDVAVFLKALASKFFVVLARLESMEDLWSLYQGEIDGVRVMSSLPGRLIVAKLVGSMSYKDICDEAYKSSAMSWGGEDAITYKSELPKLIQYLDSLDLSHPKPTSED